MRIGAAATRGATATPRRRWREDSGGKIEVLDIPENITVKLLQRNDTMHWGIVLDYTRSVSLHILKGIVRTHACVRHHM